MRPAFIIASLALLLAAQAWAGGPCAGLQRDEAPLLQRVGPHLWQVVGHAEAAGTTGPASASTTLVLVRDGPRTWLLGSGPTPAFGAAVACAVRRKLGRDVTDVVNTRAHAGLALGNAAFPGARLWALGGVARAMKQQCPQCLARSKDRLGAVGDSLTPSAIRLPTRRVDDGAASGSLGPFRWWALLRAPGSPVLMLRHRAGRIVIAQGLVWPGAVPDLRETTLAQMRTSLGRLQALVPASAQHHTLLGEAGGPGSQADVASHLAYLDALQRAVSAALQRGDVEGSPSAALALPEFAGLAHHAERHPLNLQRAWRELEAVVFR